MLIEGEREIHLVTWNESHFHQLYPIANNPKIAMNLRDSYPHPTPFTMPGIGSSTTRSSIQHKTSPSNLKADWLAPSVQSVEKTNCAPTWSWDFG